MEENNNALPTEEPKTGKKRNYKSATQRISEMKIATANAQHPPVADALKTVGYTDESLAALQAEVAEVENLDLNQQKEYADQYTETDKVDTKRADITQTYLKHLGLARIMFRNDTEAQVKLGLQGRQKKAYAAWLKDVKSFYAQLTGTPNLLEVALTRGIPQADIDAVQAEIAALEKLKESQKKETAEAQMATEARDVKFDEVEEKYLEMINYAKVLMGADQALEALGIVVKR